MSDLGIPGEVVYGIDRREGGIVPTRSGHQFFGAPLRYFYFDCAVHLRVVLEAITDRLEACILDELLAFQGSA